MTMSELMQKKILQSIVEENIPDIHQKRYAYAVHSASKQGVQNFSDAVRIAKSVVFQDKEIKMPEDEKPEDGKLKVEHEIVKDQDYQQFKQNMQRYEDEKTKETEDDPEQAYQQFKQNMQRYEDEAGQPTDADKAKTAADEKDKTDAVTIPTSSNFRDMSDGAVFVKKGDKLVRTQNYSDDSFFDKTKMQSRDSGQQGAEKKKKELIQTYRDTALSCKGKTDEEIETFLRKKGRL